MGVSIKAWHRLSVVLFISYAFRNDLLTNKKIMFTGFRALSAIASSLPYLNSMNLNWVISISSGPLKISLALIVSKRLTL